MNARFITAPATDAAKQWSGWGTALKPASEHWILVRKPVSEKNVAANVLKWGTGGINVDGCRIATTDKLGGGAEKAETVCSNNHEGWDRPWKHDDAARAAHAERVRSNVARAESMGRFPANLVLSHSPHCTDDQCDIECAIRALDEQSGTLKTGNGPTVRAGFGYQGGAGNVNEAPRPANSGGASRFFYCAKISPSERGEGNNHPTVKPQKLMRYLCRLITPPGGAVLDPFMGSGSTGMAAKSEGFKFIGVERDAEYYKIAETRIANAPRN